MHLDFRMQACSVHVYPCMLIMCLPLGMQAYFIHMCPCVLSRVPVLTLPSQPLWGRKRVLDTGCSCGALLLINVLHRPPGRGQVWFKERRKDRRKDSDAFSTSKTLEGSVWGRFQEQTVMYGEVKLKSQDQSEASI